MQCPVCDVTLSISAREGVEIDFCPQCRGVWLDRGELDKVIERAGASVAAVRASDPGPSQERSHERWDGDDGYRSRDSYRDHGQDRKKKKKKGLDFLEDIFDF